MTVLTCAYEYQRLYTADGYEIGAVLHHVLRAGCTYRSDVERRGDGFGGTILGETLEDGASFPGVPY